MNKYFPENLIGVADLQALKIALSDELFRISATLNQLVEGHIDISHKAVSRPREGDMRRPDGANWNPASVGAGIVWFDGASWRYLWDKKIVLDATTSPTKDDNGSLGYSLGSIVINQSAGAAHMLVGLESANASANWRVIT